MNTLYPTPWIPIRDGDPRARAIYDRHYSARHYRDGRRPKKFVGPGEYLALMTLECDALLVWRKFRDPSGQTGIMCSIFRNESAHLSSRLIAQACKIAWARWPGTRLYTYVNPRKIRSTNPGYCFLRAGWQHAGRTKRGLIILEHLPTYAQQRRQP